MRSIVQKIKSTKARKAVAIAAVLVLVALLAGMAACSAATFSNEVGAGRAIGEAMAGIADEADGIELPDPEEDAIDAPNAEPGDNKGADSASAQRETGSSSDQGVSGQAAAPSGSVGNSGTSHQQSGGSQPTGSSQAPSQQRRWVEDTERVWVEDKAAWSEQVPVYGTKEVSLCNICGADVTGNASAHGKSHMLAGEGSGHHSEVRQTVTGYNTVSHPAEGHWETRVVGGHWE